MSGVLAQLRTSIENLQARVMKLEAICCASERDTNPQNVHDAYLEGVKDEQLRQCQRADATNENDTKRLADMVAWSLERFVDIRTTGCAQTGDLFSDGMVFRGVVAQVVNEAFRMGRCDPASAPAFAEPTPRSLSAASAASAAVVEPEAAPMHQLSEPLCPLQGPCPTSGPLDDPFHVPGHDTNCRCPGCKMKAIEFQENLHAQLEAAEARDPTPPRTRPLRSEMTLFDLGAMPVPVSECVTGAFLDLRKAADANGGLRIGEGSLYPVLIRTCRRAFEAGIMHVQSRPRAESEAEDWNRGKMDTLAAMRQWCVRQMAEQGLPSAGEDER